jgi:hypothetical protein
MSWFDPTLSRCRNERTDHLALRRRQGAAHLEAAEVDRTRHDQRLDDVDADCVRETGLKQRVPAHGRSPPTAASIDIYPSGSEVASAAAN